MSNGDIVNLDFSYKCLTYSSGAAAAAGAATIKVYYSTSSATGPWTEVNSFNNVSSATCVSAPLTTFTPAAGNLYVRLQGNRNSGDFWMVFDDISITQGAPPTCFPPTGIIASSITTTSATISWTAPASPPAMGYDYIYSTSSTPPTAGSTPSGSTSVGITTANLMTLTPNTLYYLWVRSVCSASDKSTWAALPTFTTLALPPANDDCSAATAFSTIPTDGNCVTLSNQSTAGATNSNVTPTGSCSSNFGTPNDDVWFSFVAPSTSLILSYTYVSGETDIYTHVFSSACGSSMTSILCTDNDAGGTITGLTIGNTYYIRMYTYYTTGPTVQNVCLKTPPPMTYVSSTTTQSSTGSVTAGTINQQIIRVAVVVNGDLNPLSVTQLNLNTNGSTNPATDISAARVFYTGTSTTFSTTTQFGTTVNTPNGSYIVSGSQVLTGGVSNTTNYFWVVYDLPCNATATNVLDGECTGVTVGALQVPSITAPTGNRTIVAATTTAITVQPSTATVTAGTINNQVLRLQLTSCVNSNVTSIDFNTTGSTNPLTDISTARVYFTTTPTFATTTQFGTDVTGPNGLFTISGSQTLATGTGYFWLVYDVPLTATGGNLLDASAISAIINGSPVIPGTANPVGTRTIVVPPANDECTSPIALTVNADLLCGVTSSGTLAGATASTGQPASTCGTFDDDVWYSFVATATSHVINIGHVSGSTSDYSFQVLSSCGASSAIICTDPTTNVTVPGLSIGNTYFVRLASYTSTSGQTSNFTICVGTLPPAPNCTTNISPADGATGVSPTPNIPLTWTAAATATSYDLYLGTTNPPTTLLGNFAGTTVNLTGTSNNNTYYWYVVPKNAGGSAVGCSSSTTSFSTVIAACTPVTTNGGTVGDALIDFVLIGEGSTSISVIGAAPVPTPGYTNLTASTTVDLAAGKAYAGNFKTADASDYVTIWIDFNNDGIFSTTEKILNGLKPAGSSITTPYSIMIPASASSGSRVMRVRNIFSVTGSIDACATYSYGEGKDFTVNILPAGSASAYVIANPATGSCVNMAQTTIDAASNNLGVLVPVLNAAGQLAAMVNSIGDLGVINTSVYIYGGSVRTDGKGVKYLDRTITITPAITASSATVRLPYTNAELAALQAVDPSVTTANLNASKFNGIACNAFPSGAGLFLAQSNNGVIGGGNYIDVNITSFSTFFLHGGLLPLPVNILSFNAQALKNKTVQLTWNVAAEVDVREYVVERSNDNRNWSAIGSVKASQKSAYDFNDNSPASGVNYYRLAIKDLNAAVAFSDIRRVNFSVKGNMALYPNPANDVLFVSGTDDKNVVVSIYNEVGQIVNTLSSNGENIRTGGIDVSQLLPGAYSIQVKGESGLTTMRFVKQ